MRMLETLMCIAFGVAYAAARKKETEEERLEKERKKKEEELLDIKLDVLCYAVSKHMLYEEAVNLINENKLAIDEIKKYLKEQRNG